LLPSPWFLLLITYFPLTSVLYFFSNCLGDGTGTSSIVIALLREESNKAYITNIIYMFNNWEIKLGECHCWSWNVERGTKLRSEYLMSIISISCRAWILFMLKEFHACLPAFFCPLKIWLSLYFVSSWYLIAGMVHLIHVWLGPGIKSFFLKQPFGIFFFLLFYTLFKTFIGVDFIEHLHWKTHLKEINKKC